MRAERTGIIPTHIIVKEGKQGELVSTDDLLQSYRNNGYSAQEVANQAYLLAESRKKAGVDDDIRAWTDAEKLVAIQHRVNGLATKNKPKDSGNTAA